MRYLVNTNCVFFLCWRTAFLLFRTPPHVLPFLSRMQTTHGTDCATNTVDSCYTRLETTLTFFHATLFGKPHAARPPHSHQAAFPYYKKMDLSLTWSLRSTLHTCNIACLTISPTHTHTLSQCSRQQPHDPILQGNFYMFHVEKCTYRI